MKKSVKNSPKISISQIINKVKQEKIQELRPRLNVELVDSLTQKDFLGFRKDINKIRNAYGISNLNPENDITVGDISIGGESQSVCGSKFIDSMNPNKRKGLHRELIKLLAKYRLPLNFYDWTESFVLYGRRHPQWKPLFNFGLLYQLADYPEWARLIPLTTEEKRDLKKQIRSLYTSSKKGKLPKEGAKLMRAMGKIVAQGGKNKIRGYKSAEEAKKVAEKKKETLTYNYGNISRTKPLSYIEIAENLKPKKDEKELKKEEARLRKIIERNKKREELILGKKRREK